MPLGRGRTAQQIVAGSQHFCVLVEDGHVGCWGDSSYGQTGYMAEIIPGDRPDLPGPERRRNSPPTTFIKFESPAKRIAASDTATCALLANGTLRCWGQTDWFAFEDPNEPTFRERMANSSALRSPSQAIVGEHTAALSHQAPRCLQRPGFCPRVRAIVRLLPGRLQQVLGAGT
jgi:alpha-tubulin suppressor-like RCC1 family protein